MVATRCKRAVEPPTDFRQENTRAPSPADDIPVARIHERHDPRSEHQRQTDPPRLASAGPLDQRAGGTIMVFSDWQIYNASPIFAFRFPKTCTLGGWLAGGIQWHKNPRHIQSIFVTNTNPGGYWEDQGYNWFGGS
jgi:hypothetical protein